ncbi:MAG: hypothetical protein COZ15_01410 [Elusimicrobia bacterium CG_4_10_14_3_um_filter_49_12_50_7]|nr:MAG: hypothetical protein COZ15_01410 [Elusimicrobia bacterium CG_4_10_14_3_um_filter_49_12_50_7]
MTKEFLAALDQIQHEKGIPKEEIICVNLLYRIKQFVNKIYLNFNKIFCFTIRNIPQIECSLPATATKQKISSIAFFLLEIKPYFICNSLN